MTDDDRTAFGECIAELAGALGATLDKPRVAGYWKALRGCDLEDVQAAAAFFLEHGGGNEAFPMPNAVQWVTRARQVALERRKEREDRLQQCPTCEGTGWVPIDQAGVRRMQRCACRAPVRAIAADYATRPQTERTWSSAREALARFEAERELREG